MSSLPSQTKTVLIFGATGKQGGAVINNLLASSTDFDIIAVTRDTSSTTARKLASRGVEVIAGNLSNPAAILASAGRPVWGVFGVQVNSSAEEQQGRALVDAAVSHGVRHFVYSSGDRGGPEESAVNPTGVQNFAAKYHIEKHLEARAAFSAQGMTYTILRPVTFFENLTTDRHGLGFARMWEQLGDKKLQLVSTADIGWFAAKSFLGPEDPRYRNAALTLVGDELTQPEGDAIFTKIVGRAMPMAPCVVGSVVKWVFKDTAGDMFAWFKEHGYGGSVSECRAIYPKMQGFRQWMEENKGLWIKAEN